MEFIIDHDENNLKNLKSTYLKKKIIGNLEKKKLTKRSELYS